jgi:Fic family protein
MRIPQPPPVLDDVADRLAGPNGAALVRHAFSGTAGGARYLPWDELRNRKPPEGLTHKEWWVLVKLARTGMRRTLPLTGKDGQPFSYALPDEVLRGIESVDKHTSGRIEVPDPVLPDAPFRERYVISSLIEEAITSSQLEGAATTRKVAKEMLETGRRPRTRDERMILNNYLGMLRVRELRGLPISPALVCELHGIVTDGTLDDAADSGRLQLPGDVRVVVSDSYGTVVHEPPPATELPARLERLCDFLNGDPDGAYVPPVVRAIIGHFMLAYDHPFADGNGRTARLLFYWAMLRQDYWLAEFLPISRLLRKAPAQYGRSFLHCEQDEGDLTYFVLYQLGIVQRAIKDLHEYLGRKADETQRLRQALKSKSVDLNYRQVALLEHAIKNPDAVFTVTSHGRSHNVVPQTARADLQGLERRGFLVRTTSNRAYSWSPANDMASRLGVG